MAGDDVTVPKWFASIIVGTLITGALGGFMALFQATAWASKIEENVKNNTQIVAITNAQYLGITQRMATVEENVKNVKENVDLIRTDQREAGRKLDTIIRNIR